MKKAYTEETRHTFAFYYPESSKQLSCLNSELFTITDQHLVRRIGDVLRLQQGDRIELFNGKTVLSLALSARQNRRSLSAVILSRREVILRKPALTVVVPLLQKNFFEQAIYAAVETGASRIVLLTTAKMKRKWGGQSERDRLQKICIAAQEQAKNYQLTQVVEPISLGRFLVFSYLF